jgi:hypothetical protein
VRKAAASRLPVSQTLIGRFVILFRKADRKSGRGHRRPVPALIFLRKWLYVKYFPLA